MLPSDDVLPPVVEPLSITSKFTQLIALPINTNAFVPSKTSLGWISPLNTYVSASLRIEEPFQYLESARSVSVVPKLLYEASVTTLIPPTVEE